MSKAGAVHHDKVGIFVKDLNAFRLGVDNRLEHFFALLERLHRQLAVGDVARYSYYILSCVQHYIADVHFNRNCCAILSFMDAF